MIALPIGNDIVIEWADVRDGRNGNILADASVAMTLRDSELQAVPGAESIALEAIAEQPGWYQGLLPASLDLHPATYWLDLTATRGGLTGFRRIRCDARHIGET